MIITTWYIPAHYLVFLLNNQLSKEIVSDGANIGGSQQT